MKHELTAKRLREALDSAGIIPADLSTRSGVSQSSISQYLSGSHAPSNVSSGKMAEILHCSPVWLMGFDVSRDAEPAAGSASSAASDLTPPEREHIRKYRAIDDDARRMVDAVLDTAFEQITGADAHASAS